MSKRLNGLYDQAERSNIHILTHSFSTTKKGMCAKVGEYEAIVMDTRNIHTELEETLVLAEELSHLETEALYAFEDVTNPFRNTNISKAEAQAKGWRIEHLLPADDFIPSLMEREGVEYWEIAERFDVPIDFVVDAVEYYRRKGKIA